MSRGTVEYRPDMTDAQVLDLCLYGFKTHKDDKSGIHKRMAKLGKDKLIRTIWTEGSPHPSYRTTDAGAAKLKEGRA